MNTGGSIIVAIIIVLLAVPFGILVYDEFLGNDASEDIYGIGPAPDLTYNGTLQELVTKKTDEGIAYYSLDGTNFTTSVPTMTDAGEYTVWCKVEDDGRTVYDEVVTAKIQYAPVTVRVNDCQKLHGEPDPVFTATVDGTLGTDTVQYTIVREQGEDCGGYVISASGEAIQGNYRLAFEDGYLVIFNEIITVTANDASKIYGSADPVFTATVNGNADISYTVTRESGEELGAYKIHVTGERIQGNYIVEFESGIFNIMASSASWSVEPESQSCVFDGWEKELVVPGTVTDGIAYYRLSTGNYSNEIPTAKEPGTYKIFCKVAGGDGIADSAEIVLTSVIEEYVWDGTETKEPRSVGGDYIINLPSELAWISKYNFANGGFSGDTLVIGHDIDLKGYEWTPIGSVASATNCPFKGTLEGDGHKIVNLTITSGMDYVGLFGYMSGGHIENLTVDTVSISGSQHVGSIAGFLNSTANRLVVTHADLDGNRYIGSIAGYQTKKISDSEASYVNLLCTRATLSTPYSLSDMGNDVGGISGMCNSDIDNCTVSHLTTIGYRNVGGIAGNIQENTITVKVSNCDLSRVTLMADLNGGNAGILVGRASESTLFIGNTNSYTSISYISTSTESGEEDSGAGPITTPPNYLSGVYDKIVVENSNVTFYKDSVATVLEDMHQIILDGVTINAAPYTPAIEIMPDAWLTIVVKNNVELVGGKDADAIRVHEGGEVILTGGGTLTVTGNDGCEYGNNVHYQTAGMEAYLNTGGSGIGNAGSNTGSIRITNLAQIYAGGYGLRAYGIGGDNGSVLITNSVVKEARGGFPETEFLVSGYGNEEAEGSPAIGGIKVVIDSSIVESAIGGSKSAGIGARFWQGADITISNSSLLNVVGGNGSAGIGGSHPERVDSATVLSIFIENSNVNAVGGYYAAGIGSGYDRKCGQNGWIDLTIVITSYSDITATGGLYAAGIGTGYHAGILKGKIDNTVTLHVTEGTDVKNGATYSHHAQGVGYGVVDYNREAASLMDGGVMVTPAFTVSGTPITNPFDPARWS
ncbi:cell surface protein [methanogenic archaeon mixed culture ISO4-G1]|nr:cell surface protein [methanogenic archaeon mixed culture ISO4-G1]